VFIPITIYSPDQHVNPWARSWFIAGL